VVDALKEMMIAMKIRMCRLGLALLIAAATAGAGCGGDGAASTGAPDDLKDGTGAPAATIPGLDYGLYWFGSGNVSRKAVAGEANPFYDPSRPTVIYIHGWQLDTTKTGKRETFNYAANDPTNGVNVNLADAWVAKGWNIGIFYWNQFADEGEVKDAEAKIWSAAGPKGMRFRLKDGTYAASGLTKSAGELFADAYVSAMQAQTNGVIRFAGHSLGNQMAVLGAKLVSERIAAGKAPARIQPKRVALLDPFWSNGGKDFLGGKWTGEMTRIDAAALVSLGVVFERYKTSPINDLWVGDRNAELTTLIGNTEIQPEYIKVTDVAGRHIAAPNLYFQSFASAPPAACVADASGNKDCSGIAPSAVTGDTDIGQMMRSSFTWVQSAGSATEDPSDNVFDRRAR